MTANILVLVVATLCAMVLLYKPVRESTLWRATSTPLGSIIGSGFLVVGPVLAHTVGKNALWAMLGLTVAAYAIGEVIRYNIAHVEPKEADGSLDGVEKSLEKGSRWALAFAYVVSVSYYATLLGAFLLQGAHLVDDILAKVVTTATLVFIGWFGWHRGLQALEQMEVGTGALKMATIFGLLAGFSYGNLEALSEGTWHTTLPLIPIGKEQVGVLLGLLIMVQGFETSHYLGDEYDAPTRIKTMRYAQLLSTFIYVVFIGTALIYFDPNMPSDGGLTAILGVSKKASTVLPAVLVIAAVMAQFGAVVADTGGGGGLLEELTDSKLSSAQGYGILCAGAVAIVWSVDIFQLIVYASKAFALYYVLQSLLTLVLAARQKAWRMVALSAGSALLCVAVMVFGISADG